MTFKKKTLGLSAFVASALILTGCASSSEPASEAGAVAQGDIPEWCGTDKEISLAMLDGFGGNPWRQIAVASAEEEVAKCPSVTSFEYADAQGDTQKAISDINAMTATGVNAMVVFADMGEPVLPAIRSAYEAGVVMVPYRSDVGGEAGEDYDLFVPSAPFDSGVLWGNWIKETYPDGATLIFAGGPAGGYQSTEERRGVDSVLTDAKYQWVGEQPFEVTDWDPAKTQQVLTAAAAKYPDIDVIVGSYGSSFIGGLQAFESAGLPMPSIAAEDGHALGCFWTENHEANPGFNVFTVTTGIDHVRLAIQHAVAIATGGVEPSEQFSVETFEDSTSEEYPVQCDPTLPLDVHLSGELPAEELVKLFG
ncbi:substrate-binding domain-containing protein [Leucobacter sp. W1038]|uniref:substrate-binding domain-containing protein n=1 Tax=Leucobacter sp. W1038 TaxID=3438281 RepID=UPI003D96E5F0